MSREGIISVLKKTDIDTISKIHSKELNEGFLVLFGEEFIKRMYKKMLENDDWGFVYKHNGKIIGYIFSSSGNVPKTNFLRIKDLLNFALNLIKKPKSILNLIYAVFKKSQRNEKFNTAIPIIDISAFAVSNDFKSKGIGKKLISAFTKKSLSEGYELISTTTHNEFLKDYYCKNKDIKHKASTSLFNFTSHYLVWAIMGEE